MSNNLTFRLDSETERMLNELVTYYLGDGTLGGTKYEEDNNDSK